MQPDSLSPQEAAQPAPSPIQEIKPPTPPKRSYLGMIVLVIFLIVAFMAFAGLGYWAYRLNSNLSATQQQLTTLQSDYASLKSDNEKLTASLNQTQTDLEKAKTDLATAQTDLKKSQDQNKELQTKIDLAGKETEVLYALSTSKTMKDFLAIDKLVQATDDQQLIKQWDEFTTSPTLEKSTKFLLYLIGIIRDELK